MRTGEIRTINSRCEVKIYHYKKQVLGDGQDFDLGELLDAEVIELKNSDNAVLSYSYDKNIASASGTFNLTLAPTKNWVNVVRPGDWLTVSLSQEGSKDKVIRLLGNIDRVAEIEEIPNDGGRSVTYSISGRDFGKVFERYSVWFNIYDKTFSTVNALLGSQGAFNIVGTSREILTKILDIFLGGVLESKGSQAQMDAYRISPQMAQDFGGVQQFFNPGGGADNGLEISAVIPPSFFSDGGGSGATNPVGG